MFSLVRREICAITHARISPAAQSRVLFVRRRSSLQSWVEAPDLALEARLLDLDPEHATLNESEWATFSAIRMLRFIKHRLHCASCNFFLGSATRKARKQFKFIRESMDTEREYAARMIRGCRPRGVGWCGCQRSAAGRHS